MFDSGRGGVRSLFCFEGVWDTSFSCLTITLLAGVLKTSIMPRSVTFPFLQVLFNFTDSTSFVTMINFLFAFTFVTCGGGSGVNLA